MAEQNDQGKHLHREYADLQGIKGQFDAELAKAIKSGDVGKAQELRTHLNLKVESLRETIGPYQLKFRQEIAKEGGHKYVGMFSPEGVARAQRPNGRWLYIDRQNNRLTPAHFGRANSFKEGFGLAVSSSPKFVKADGSALEFDIPVMDAKDFSDGFAAIRVFGSGDKPEWRFIDKEGRRVVERIFIDNESTSLIEHAGSFSSGLAPVTQFENDGGWYFIDKSGIAKVRSKLPNGYFYKAREYSEGLAAVKLDHNSQYWEFINTSGETEITGQYEEVKGFSEGLAAVKLLSWFYIDKQKKILLGQNYYEAESFSEGLALVKKANEPYKFIDKDGTEIISLKENETAKSFSEGVAEVTWRDFGSFIGPRTGTYYIDHKGNRIF